MTAATRVSESTAAVEGLYVAIELGSTKWSVAFGTRMTPRVRAVALRGDVRAAFVTEVSKAKARLGVAPDAPVYSCYEAGRDGFWVHRWLTQVGVTNVVVDSASIAVNRRARRAKTDRLDAAKLLTMLLRWTGGEGRVWRTVRVPSVADEAARQLPREIQAVHPDRTRLRNRIHGLLATHGVRLPLTAAFPDRVATVATGDGQPLPALLQERLTREWTQLEAINARLAALDRARHAHITTGTDRVATVARQLTTLRGVADPSALVFSAELFGTRTFANGREVSALSGLVPVPYRSDQQVGDQGISQASRPGLRATAIQIAWGWLQWQPQSALTRWFHARFSSGKRSRRTGIVAVARKLLVALWRYVAHGVVPEGAVLKAA